MNIQVVNLEGKKVGTEEAFSKWENREVSPKLMHQVAVDYDTNSRVSRAHTKDRSERRGGGIKPWRQKGTGRARAGSSRSPIWRKGGIAFGPRAERNYAAYTPVSMKRTALAGVLVGKVRDEEMIVLDELPKISGKTKELVATFEKLSVKGSAIFLVSGPKEKRAIFARAGRNIPNVHVMNPETVTANDLLVFSSVVTDRDGLKALEKRVTKSSKEKGN